MVELCRSSTPVVPSLGRRLFAEAPAYSGAQTVGAIGGAALANAMFGLDAVSISQHHPASPGITGHHRASGPALLAEAVATAGLIMVIFSLARSGRGALSAVAVGAYIGSAYWFTSSTSFANPAVTIGRIFSDTFAGIAPGSLRDSLRRNSSALPWAPPSCWSSTRRGCRP